MNQTQVGPPNCSIPIKKGFAMFRSSAPLALAAGLMLSACVTTGSGTASTNANTAAALQAGEWRVEDIAGAGVIDGSNATLMFGADGKLSGDTSCNRLIASYTVEGDKLTISPAGTTMMACPPALMKQEHKLVALLGKVNSYSIDQTGALTLIAASGEKIIARH